MRDLDLVVAEVEVRESSRAGYEPTLHGTIITEGRAASGGRRELFAPGSVTWPAEGVGILLEHRGAVETRGHPIRHRDGRITIQARATEAIRRAVESGRRFMSVEFLALEERTTKGGVRELLKALVDSAALTSKPEYDTTRASIRTSTGSTRRVLLWL